MCGNQSGTKVNGRVEDANGKLLLLALYSFLQLPILLSLQLQLVTQHCYSIPLCAVNNIPWYRSKANWYWEITKI